MKKAILFFIPLLLCAGCGKNKMTDKCSVNEEYVEKCCCPPMIYLLPLNDFTQEEARQVKKQMLPFIKEFIDEDIIEVKPNKKLDSSFLNSAKTRYSATKILDNYKDSTFHNHDVIIGLLHDDISVPYYKDKRDWGVLGLSYQGKNVAVVSSYRVKNKRRDLWRVAVHEFCHAFFDLPHCPDDNPHCIVKSAKGHPDFSNKTDLCANCKKHCGI